MCATTAMPEAENIPLNKRRKLLRRFREQYGITLDEFGERAGLSKGMLSLFENGGRDLSPEAWTRVLAAMSNLITGDNARRLTEIEKAKETATKLGVWWRVEDIFSGKGPWGFLTKSESEEQIAKAQAEIEAEKIRLQEVSNLSKIIVEQTDELLPHLKKDALAYIRKNPEKVLQEYSALTEWRQKILDLEVEGCAFFRKSDVEAKDKRIAELEQELRALKATEQSNG